MAITVISGDACIGANCSVNPIPAANEGPAGPAGPAGSFPFGIISSIVDYGADPTGVEDSLAAFHAALAAGADVVVPVGTYLVSASVMVPSGSRIIGIAGSVVVTPSGATFAAFDFDGVTDVMVTQVTVQSAGVPGSNNFGFYIRGDSADIRFIDCVADGMAGGFIIRGENGTVPGVCERISHLQCRGDRSTSLWGFEASYADVVDYIACHATLNDLDGFKIRARTTNVTFTGGSATFNGQDPVNAGDGIDAFAGGDTFVITDFVADDNLGNGLTIKTDELTRDDPAFYGYVRLLQVTNVRCRRNNPGYGMTLEVFRASRNDYFDNPPADNAATIPMPQHAVITGGLFEENFEEGIWVDGHDILLNGCIARRNGEHGIEVGVRSINVTLRDVMSIANGQSAINTYYGVYLRGQTIRMQGGHVFGVDPDIVRTAADLAAATPQHAYNVVVDSAFSADVIIENVTQDYSNVTPRRGIRSNMTTGFCVIKQRGAGVPTGFAYGGVGSEYVDTTAVGPDGNLWLKGRGDANDPTVGWVRIFTPRMITVVAGDFALNAAWGDGASIAVDAGSTVAAGRAVVTAGTANTAAGAGITFTFPGGAFSVAPRFRATRNRGNATATVYAWWNDPTTTSVLITQSSGTPAINSTWGFEWETIPLQGN